MRIRIFNDKVLALAALFSLALTGWCAPARGEDWSLQKAEATFRNKCNHCHTVPDSASPYDRAWLDQVKRTA